MKKVVGFVLLAIGLLSLIGGISHPSGAAEIVVVLGYVLKFAFIVGGFYLLFSSSKEKNK